MRQIWITRAGDPSVLQVKEAPDPTPGPGQVRIAVEAAGVNFADLSARMGTYQDMPAIPCVVGYEVSGTIDAVGEGVDRSRVGEPVLAMTKFGGYSSSVVVDSPRAVVRPKGMDAVTGACIPVVGITAWMMTEVHGRVRAGDRVLVHSAGGGVGLAVLDLVKWRGGFAIGTASAGKHAFLKERGFDQLIDYRTEDFEAVLKDGPGLDLVLDPVGGASWGKGIRLLRAGGKLVMFGFSAQSSGDQPSTLERLKAVWGIPWLEFNPINLINKNIGVAGVNMGRMWHEADRCTEWLHELLVLWERGTFRPVLHATVPFDQAAEAHHILHRRENVGKVVLIP